MAKYQVEVTETVYYYILVEAENEEEAKNLSVTRIDPRGMDYSGDFNEVDSSIAMDGVWLLEEGEARRPIIEIEMSKLYALTAQ